jgi:hypothetical protein
MYTNSVNILIILHYILYYINFGPYQDGMARFQLANIGYCIQTCRVAATVLSKQAGHVLPKRGSLPAYGVGEGRINPHHQEASMLPNSVTRIQQTLLVLTLRLFSLQLAGNSATRFSGILVNSYQKEWAFAFFLLCVETDKSNQGAKRRSSVPFRPPTRLTWSQCVFSTVNSTPVQTVEVAYLLKRRFLPDCMMSIPKESNLHYIPRASKKCIVCASQINSYWLQWYHMASYLVKTLIFFSIIQTLIQCHLEADVK